MIHATRALDSEQETQHLIDTGHMVWDINQSKMPALLIDMQLSFSLNPACA
jgi:hypothetical protein